MEASRQKVLGSPSTVLAWISLLVDAGQYATIRGRQTGGPQDMVNISKSKIAADIPVAERAVSRRRNLSDVLSDEDFIPKSSLSPGEIADGIVLHVSCQVQQVPHIPSIAASIAAQIGVSVTMVGGAEFCCGAYHRHAGDIDFENQIATASLKGIGRSGAREFVSFCPSCDDSFGRYNSGTKLRQINLTQFLVERIHRLKPLLRPVPCNILLHRHLGDDNRLRDSANIRTLLGVIPGVRIRESPLADGEGPSCQSFRPMSKDRTAGMFAEAQRQGVDFVVVPYHSCYRQHCKMQIEYGIEVHHYLGLLAKSLGIGFREGFKELRLLDDVDEATARVGRRAAELGFSSAEVQSFMRKVVYC